MKLSRMLFPVATGVVALLGFVEDAYIQSDGTQYIKTDYFANPNTKIVCDFAYTSATPTQQRVFGADSDDAHGR